MAVQLICRFHAMPYACPGVDRSVACPVRMRSNKLDGPYDNRVMPIVLSATLIVALSITFGSSIVAYEHDS